MIVGIPKEIMQNERRVSATPETVALMVKDGLTVHVERSAGEGSHYTDEDYKKSGAVIVDDVAQVFEKADVILKVKEPKFNNAKNRHEVDMMHSGQHLITFIHPAAPSNHDMVKAMAEKGVISMTLDGLPRIDRAAKLDPLISMSICAGYKGMLMAMDSLTMFMPKVDTIVGTIPPATVLVIGAGVSGMQSIDVAVRMGADVYYYDVRPEAGEMAKKMGAKPAVDNMTESSTSRSPSEEELKQEREKLADIIKKCEIVVTTALIPNRLAPILITEDMVKTMKPGSVIVDISVDQGGNCELTEAGQVVTKHGVIINGINNLPGRIPNSSTYMFSKNIYEMFKYVLKDGKIAFDMEDEIIKGILTTYNGKVVHEGALEAMA
ncbi:MAG: NAD(P) transhydrogenase subunit alpha [Turicibacter sp.]|nr:NAD(P) transhydrogenase subunit alpha [Turicibacter sp.]